MPRHACPIGTTANSGLRDGLNISPHMQGRDQPGPHLPRNRIRREDPLLLRSRNCQHRASGSSRAAAQSPRHRQISRRQNSSATTSYHADPAPESIAGWRANCFCSSNVRVTSQARCINARISPRPSVRLRRVRRHKVESCFTPSSESIQLQPAIADHREPRNGRLLRRVPAAHSTADLSQRRILPADPRPPPNPPGNRTRNPDRRATSR